jgi:8-amino-7-oxononanoate synthase
MQGPPGPYTLVDGRRYLYFVGTGYLGLQNHPEVIRALCEAAQQYGMGSATSRAGFGNTPPLLEVERRAAELFAAEDSFYVPSGYAAGGILVRGLAGSFDAVFIDERSHYSLAEAEKQVGCPVFLFGHGDADDLRAGLRDRLKPRQRPLVMSDGLFAARGRIAPVAEHREILREYAGSALLLDDAHAVAVLGEHGRGTFEHAGIYEAVNSDDSPRPLPLAPRLFLCGTFSKAIGGYGGIIPGSQGFIARLKATSHWYDGASAVPSPLAVATARAIELVMADPGMRTRLWDNARRLKAGLRKLGLGADDTPAPIVCLVVGSADNMRRIQARLRERGILVAYMAAYAGLGPEGALRLAVFANHTPEMIEELLDGLRGVL